MKIGVVFPQTEIGSDPAVIRDYAQAAEGAGYQHLLVFDHVLGGKLERFEKLGRRPALHRREPIPRAVRALRLPRRGDPAARAGDRHHHPAAAADRARRQAGRGRRRAHARPPAPRRGHRLELRRVRGAERGLPHPRPPRQEQIAVMRKLWTEPSSPSTARIHHIDRAGINPLPVQRPIPVWMGGTVEPVLKRLAEIADGWFPQFQPGDEAGRRWTGCAAISQAAGRAPSAVGIEGRFAPLHRRPGGVGAARAGVARPRRDPPLREHDERRASPPRATTSTPLLKMKQALDNL